MQAHWLDGQRSGPIAGNARGRDLDVAAETFRSGLLQRNTPSAPLISTATLARPARPEQTKSSRQLSRFCYLINSDKDFGTHRSARRHIVVNSLFSRHQFLQKAARKITLRCFHQAGHQIFWHSVESSVLIDFGVDRISEAICRDAVDENANHPAVLTSGSRELRRTGRSVRRSWS